MIWIYWDSPEHQLVNKNNSTNYQSHVCQLSQIGITILKRRIHDPSTRAPSASVGGLGRIDNLVYLSNQPNHNIVYIRPGWAGYHQSVNFFQSVIRIMIL